jgi:hypothetical protein
MLSAFLVSPIFIAKSAYANITLTSSGVPENSPTALDKILLPASKFFVSQYALTRFKKIRALSSYPKGNEYFLLAFISFGPIASLTPGSSYAYSKVFKALGQSPCFISTSDFINIKTGFSLILKS